MPDIVIEVIITSGSINKLEVYKPQNIPEVWFWKSSQLQVFHLKDGLDYPDQYDAVQAFQSAIRETLQYNLKDKRAGVRANRILLAFGKIIC